MVQVVTQTADNESKALNLPKNLPPCGRCENGEHHLCNVERVTPIVISHMAIIFLHAQQPPTKHLVVNVEAFDEVKVEEHPKTSFEGVVVVQIQVIKGEVMQLEICRRRDFESLMTKK